jgi:hypothetical protein
MKSLPAFLALLALWLGGFAVSSGAETDESPLFPAPADLVLDRGDVFQPEAVARLRSMLQAARAKGVTVYLLTIPSLGVLPSKQQEKLEALGQRYTKNWLPSTSGAVIVFDDESGLMNVGLSDEASLRFSDVALQFELGKPIEDAQKSGLSRDKLEKVATIAVQIMTGMEAKYQQERKRQIVVNCLMGVLAVVGLVLILRSTFRDGPEPAPVDAEKTEEATKTPPEA